MGQVREVDAISDAMVETDKEIAGDAWGNEETSALDETGNRALESIGDGLEGQHEIDGEPGSEEQEGEAGEEGEAEEGEDGDEGEADGEEAAAGEEGEAEAEPAAAARTEPAGRVPSGKLREEAEKRRRVEEQLEAERNARAEDRKAFETLQTQVQTLTQLLSGQQRQQPQAPVKEEAKAEPEVPDIFENPKGFADYILNSVQQAVAPVRQDVRKTQVETSFALAHATHKDTFAKAFDAVQALNPQNPDDRATVQRIYNSPNPGEELVKWHKRNTALARVGDDPDVFVENIRKETRETLLKDPEFRKQLLADLRAEASTGENGAPRTTIRLPKSGERARAGSNVGAERMDHSAQDNSDQSVADAAWR